MTRRLWDIPGGIHPPQRKTLSNQQPIRKAPIAKRLILPLQQHIGTPATPIVQPGDYVLKGQKIAEAEGFVSVPLHAPTSGSVKEIVRHSIPHPSGMSEPCIIIDSDGNDQWCPLEPLKNYHDQEPEALVKRIREAGIAGLGGAGFPSAVKLRARTEQEINTLIINGTECEPYITADDLLMQEHSEAVISGIEILCAIIKPSEILIGVEDNKPLAIQRLKECITTRKLGFNVVSIPTKYPSGGEKQLIQILTGKEVPSGELPADLGIVCQNVGTTKAIHDAIVLGQPLISRITTLTGEALAQPGNLDVLIGTPINDLLAFCEADNARMQRLIIGGPMMGYTLQESSSPIIKTVNCVIASSLEELPPPDPAQACIRCGACAEVCPVNLLPQQLYWHSKAKDYNQLKHHNLFDCIECGACSFSCPSHIPLVQYYRASKADIRAHEAMQQKAEYSKMRFEAREARMQRIEDEKAAKRKANAERAAKLKAAKAVAASTPNTEAPDNEAKASIDAAVARSRGVRDTDDNTQTPPVEDKALKIQRAMINAQLKKLNRQLATASAENREKLTADITQLDQQLQALGPAPAPTETTKVSLSTTDKEHKIKIAMAKAAIKKSTRALSQFDEGSEESAAARQELEQHRVTLAQLEQSNAASNVVADDIAASPKPKLSAEQKKLKISAAMAQAALKKAERCYAEAAENQSSETEALAAKVEQLQQELAEAKRRLANHSESTHEEPSRESQAGTSVSAPSPRNTEELKQLKIRQAMARAALNKLVKSAETAANGQTPEQQLSIENARLELDQATTALNNYTADSTAQG